MDHLLTEARNPASANLDRMTAVELVRLTNAEDAKVPVAVAAVAEPIARGIDLIANRLGTGGRLIYVGAGTSGRLGVLDAAECPPTFNTSPGQVIGIIAGGLTALTSAIEGAEDNPVAGASDLERIQVAANDVVVGIATSGRTPYVIGALEHARSVGAATIGLTCVADSDLQPFVDIQIAPLVGPEVLTGSTRLKAGTATKLVLNTLSTGAMVRLGKAFGNLMVDLRATNMKLRARTNRIVRQLIGLDVKTADELLARCDGELKTAIVVGRTGLSPTQARERLAAVGGRVADAFDAPLLRYPDWRLGLDGGGSHTVALLADATGRVLGRGVAGPSNWQATGSAQALANVDEAIDRAFTATGQSRGIVGAGVLGIAGAGRPGEQAIIEKWATEKRLADTIRVVGDIGLPIALLPDHWGVAVVAGTGSCVWAQAPDGRSARAGGWGPLLGDEGSGYALALNGLRFIARQADRREPSSSLTDRILTRMGLREPTQIIAAVNSGEWGRARLAGLAEDVIRSADEGDVAASAIVEQQLDELSECMIAAVRSLALPTDNLPLALAGGLLVQSPSYRDRFIKNLQRRRLHCTPVLAISEPAEGAIRLACQLAGSATS
ncbi:MAG TPA: N-acetylmuramic acid 6-phosphate etherase [Gemmataceae bacterium]|jgi:N-acetylmuramic acid 6-phosphate etherase|nr:N-acetylmuramic acid 6-phosphate etherase [Gemmataceae bacterium]